MLEIVINPRQTFNLKQAVIEAIESGTYDSLYDDIRDCFNEAQVDEIEEVLESGDIAEAIDEIVNEWNAEDLDELFEIIENYFAEASVDVQFLHDEDFNDEFDESEEKEPDEFDDDIAETEEEADEEYSACG